MPSAQESSTGSPAGELMSASGIESASAGHSSLTMLQIACKDAGTSTGERQRGLPNWEMPPLRVVGRDALSHGSPTVRHARAEWRLPVPYINLETNKGNMRQQDR